MALFTYGWPFSKEHQMFGLWHQWSCLTTCEWPPPNLWVAPVEFMDGPSTKNFKNFSAKTDQFYTVTLTNFSKLGPSPLQLPLIWVFVHFRARSLISIEEWMNVYLESHLFVCIARLLLGMIVNINKWRNSQLFHLNYITKPKSTFVTCSSQVQH